MIPCGRVFSRLAATIALAAAGLVHAGELVPLSHHLNDIDSVRCDGTRVHFMGQDGTLTFDTTTSSWTIDTVERYPHPTLDREHYWDRRDVALSSRLENGPLRAAYISAQRGIAHDTTLMVLAATADEGAVNTTQCVVDTAPQIAYCFPLNYVKALDFDSQSIWLGSFRGAAHLDRGTGRRSDYAVLPLLDENCSVFHDSSHIWIAADGMGIQRIDLDTHRVEFWPIDELLSSLHQRWKAHRNSYQEPKGKAVFTNFEMDGDDLVVACRFVSGGDFLVGQSSYLLSFSHAEQSWHAEWITLTEGRDAVGVTLVRRFGPFLWIGCGHQDTWEGASHREFGGLFLTRREQRNNFWSEYWKPNEMDVVNHRYLVTAMDIRGDQMFVETFYPSPEEECRRTIYKVDTNARITVLSDSLDMSWNQDGQPHRSLCDEYYQRVRHLPYRGAGALPDSLLKTPVAPVIRLVPTDSVEVIRR